MNSFSNSNPRDVQHAVTLLKEARADGRHASIAGGGSDLLGMIKEHLVAPDVIVNLKAMSGVDRVTPQADRSVAIGGLITLDALAHDPAIRERYAVLAEAATSVGTPQIRNVGTLAGNVCQRPWCWYFRNGFNCFKAGGNTCYAVNGENQFHAIFGGGPSQIVHPSDTAPALVALDATFHIAGPGGERAVAAADFFALPRVDPRRENVLAQDELLARITLPPPRSGVRGTYQKVLDREAWTHAVVSAAVTLEMAGKTCRGARIVLGGVAPIPWRLPEVERLLAGKPITEALAAKAGEAAVAGAKPLAKNGYKVPLTQALVARTILELATRT
jgi:xanthine dehydrogenase YagS FAD-binding subunit